MEQKTVAFYRDMDSAIAVRNDLIDSGISRSDITIYEGKEPGLWESIKETFGFADEEDRHLYHEAARMGGVAVVLDLESCTALERSEALRVIRDHDPMNLEGASPMSQSEGWQDPDESYGGDASDFPDPDSPYDDRR